MLLAGNCPQQFFRNDSKALSLATCIRNRNYKRLNVRESSASACVLRRRGFKATCIPNLVAGQGVRTASVTSGPLVGEIYRIRGWMGPIAF